MSHEPPDHLKSKYRCYALTFESDYGSRPSSEILIVHVGRPMSFETFCESYVFSNIELTIEKTGAKLHTNRICGIQKVPDQNKPAYELAMSGRLLEVLS